MNILNNIKILISSLPSTDIVIAEKFLEQRDFESLMELVSSSVIRIKRSKAKGYVKYNSIDIDNLEKLQSYVSTYLDQLGISEDSFEEEL